MTNPLLWLQSRQNRWTTTIAIFLIFVAVVAWTDFTTWLETPANVVTYVFYLAGFGIIKYVAATLISMIGSRQHINAATFVAVVVSMGAYDIFLISQVLAADPKVNYFAAYDYVAYNTLVFPWFIVAFMILSAVLYAVIPKER